jgi:hypothetical protein
MRLRQEVALHRWAVIAEAANPRLSAGERGSAVRAAAARQHAHPDGTVRRYSRGTVGRWLRAHRAGGVDGLRPAARSDTGKVRIAQENMRQGHAPDYTIGGNMQGRNAAAAYSRREGTPTGGAGSSYTNGGTSDAEAADINARAGI